MGVFLQTILLKEDPFLNNIAAKDRPTLIRYFAEAVREQEFLIMSKSKLDQTPTKEAVDKVAEMFMANNQNNPRYGKYGKQDLQLQIQLRSYNNKDPETNQENLSLLSYLANFSQGHYWHSAVNSKPCHPWILIFNEILIVRKGNKGRDEYTADNNTKHIFLESTEQKYRV